ncbi:histidine phosphatase family protein [Lonepinella sp. BR2474]|uniref:histidine phosphatase family protein n=1 Tax=Lonepinella sp. BR2474 TaxID=3434548 RepID=UPI003F6E1228
MNKDLRFYFVRHGRTIWNEKGLMQGSGNSNLTEQGVQGAVKTGEVLQTIPFVAAYSSCLQRTIDTAHHILGERDVPLFQHNGLNEHHFGSWEGTLVDNIRQHPEFQQMVNDPKNYQARCNNGETWQQLAERATKAIQDIIKIHDKGNILIVSHGHTLRLLIALLNGATWQNHRENGKSETLANTSISVVRYVQEENAQGRFIVEKVNDVGHLG